MKIKMVFLALAFLAIASVSHAQSVGTVLLQSSQVLGWNCDGGGDFIPDGSIASVRWDQNNNGPDGTDPLAPVGGGVDEGNYNQFALNGNDYLGIPGGFYADPAFVFAYPTNAVRRFYIVVESPNARWTSRTFQLINGLSDEDLTGSFTCEVLAIPCDEPTHVGIETVGGRNFLANGPYYQCIRVCAGTTVHICLGPLADDEFPHALVLPGCLGNGCDVQCPPAQFGYDPAAWVYDPLTGTWCNWIVAGSDGCVCFCLEFIEAVGVDLNVVAMDGAVEVNWTAEGADIASFEVARRVVGHEFETIATVAHTQTSYTYVDANASNGTMYEYTLNLIDVAGNRTALGTIASATPSVNNAVITEYALHQNYPNPFNPSTNLVFDVVSENNVSLTVYNATGQEVATLVNGTMAAGRHTVSFDAANLTSGLYFYTVKIGNEFTATKKMLLVK